MTAQSNMTAYSNLFDAIGLLEKRIKNSLKNKLKENAPGGVFSEEEKALLAIAIKGEFLKLMDDLAKSFLKADFDDCEDIIDWLTDYIEILKD